MMLAESPKVKRLWVAVLRAVYAPETVLCSIGTKKLGAKSSGSFKR